VNTNPIVMDAAGGANIWLASSSYKLILKTAFGATIWTVDQVKGGGGLGGVCGPAGAVQVANSGVNGLTCDSSITVNTTNHTLNVGTLPSSHVSIGALGTPTAWVFDTTTAATALASLGGGVVNAGAINQLAYYAEDGEILSGTFAIPSGTTATTQSPSDSSTKVATTAYVAAPGIVNPTSVQIASGTAMTANQGTGVKVQHSTGTTTTDNCAKFDAAGNTVDAGAPCAISVTLVTGSEIVGSRAFGATYQNLTGYPILVSGNGQAAAGGSTAALTCGVGPSSPSENVYSNGWGATTAGGFEGFSCPVPANSYYRIDVSGDIGIGGSSHWHETQVQ
jgi:hypothetical protein